MNETERGQTGKEELIYVKHIHPRVHKAQLEIWSHIPNSVGEEQGEKPRVGGISGLLEELRKFMTTLFYTVVTDLSVVLRVIKPQPEKGRHGQFTLGLCP